MVAVFAVVKNEERDIAEWIAFHLATGFDSVILYDNASEDRTPDVAREFASNYDVRVMEWPESGRLWQFSAYMDGVRRFKKEFEWGLFLDTDEFILGYDRNLPPSFGGDVGQVLFNCAFFGSGGHKNFPPGLIIEEFLYRAPIDFRPNRHTKALVRLSRATGCTNPHFFGVSGRSVDFSGRNIVWSEKQGIIAGTPDWSGPRVNHYFTRSEEHWRRRMTRGNHDVLLRRAAEFEYYSAAATVRDEALLPYTPAVRAILSDLNLLREQSPACSGSGYSDSNRIAEVNRSMEAKAPNQIEHTEQERASPRDDATQARQPCPPKVRPLAGIGIGGSRYNEPPSGLKVDLQTWGSPEDQPIFEEVMKRHRPRILIEIGTWKGASVLHMHKLSTKYDIGTHFICIDTWLGSNAPLWLDPKLRSLLNLTNGYPNIFQQFIFNAIASGAQEDISPFPITSTAGAHTLKKLGIQADALYIDAGNEEDEVYADLTHYYDLVKEGGAIFGDDYEPGWPGVVAAVNRFCAERNIVLSKRGAKFYFRKPAGRRLIGPPGAQSVSVPSERVGGSGEGSAQQRPMIGAETRSARAASAGNQEQNFQGLVMDIGVSEGNDTAYYLSKGFRVVAVEADPDACRALRTRFAREISSGALVLLHFAASAAFGDYVTLFVHNRAQGVSSIYKRPDVDPAGYSEHQVMTIDWRTLRAQAGVPRYLKIDIERQEERFLAGMAGDTELPEFISVEAYELRPCEMLCEMGYRRFRLVDQNPPGGLQLPTRQFEGLTVASADFRHASGPFGLDIFGEGNWLDFQRFEKAWEAARPEMARTWFDCHAWKPN